MQEEMELMNAVGPITKVAAKDPDVARKLVAKAVIAGEMALRTTPLAADPVLLEAIEIARNWAAGKASAEQVDAMMLKIRARAEKGHDLTVQMVGDLVFCAQILNGNDIGAKKGAILNLGALISLMAPPIIRQNAPDKAEEMLQELLVAVKK